MECKQTFDGAAATAKVDRKDFASAASVKGDAKNDSSAATAEVGCNSRFVPKHVVDPLLVISE